MIKNSIQIDRNSNLLSVPSVEAPKANSEKKGICLSRQVRFISSAYFLCISFSLSILIVLIFVVVNSIDFLFADLVVPLLIFLRNLCVLGKAK